jgi:hypothetical protein
MGLRGRLPVVVALAVAGVSAGLPSAAVGRPGRVRVGCDNVIGYDSTHQAKEAGRWRLVLGTASVPVSLQRAFPVSGFRRWRYWSKQGVDVLAGAGPPVEISLPPSWTTKARLTWGNGRPRGRTIVFSRCGPELSHPRGETWLAYAGGFYINGPRACVPLRIRVGGATASVTVSIGRRCH